MKLNFAIRPMKRSPVLSFSGNYLLALMFSAISLPLLAAQIEPGFVSLFDGRSLDGWRLVDKRGDGYGATNGVIYCARGGGGDRVTQEGLLRFLLRLGL